MAAEVVHKNQSHLAAIRNFFDKLVVRHTVVLNPALSVRGPRYSQREGKTPAFASPKQARELLESIDTSHVVGLRDRAVLGTFTFISVRANAVAKQSGKITTRTAINTGCRNLFFPRLRRLPSYP